MFKVLTRTAQ